jgi:peptidyl-prolyl cis-trans isomerase C
MSAYAAGAVLAEDKVLAKVNGHAITEADVRNVEVELGMELTSIPADKRQQMVVEYLIQHELFATAAEKDKLDQGTSYESRLAYYKRRALRDTYYEKMVHSTVTEAEARKFYDEQAKAAADNPQIKARHILVEKEADARDLREKLARGEDFAALAKAHSKDPGSGAQGGDLGFLQKGQTVKAFDETLQKLKPGEISDPVQTEFGWHIIQVQERRALPPFDGLKDRIVGRLVQQKAQAVSEDLRSKAQIEFVDPALKALMAPAVAPGEIKPLNK